MSGGIFEELEKMAPSVGVAEVNGCLLGLRAPSVAGAEPSVVSPSGAELELRHQLMGKAHQWEESWETWGNMAQGRKGGKCGR